MALPVKTRILQAIVAAVAAIPTVTDVKRNPPSPPKRESMTGPVVFIYDDTESRVQNNRYSSNSFPVQIETYFFAEDQGASDAADVIDCEIYKAVLQDHDVLSLVTGIKPEEAASSKKGYIDEFLGVLICRYIVSFKHAAKDPTDPVRTVA